MDFRYKEKSNIARHAGVTVQHLSQLLSRKARASAEVAARLEEACEALGIRITKEDFVFSKETKNTYFNKRG